MLSMRTKTGVAGFTLIELIVGVVILGILAAIAAPNFQTWILNTQVRNAAEAVANGLQRARAEAVARNASVQFKLSGTGSGWVLSVGGTDFETRSANEGSKKVTITATAADASTANTITYNSFGSVAANTDGSKPLAQIEFSANGTLRKLRVTIGTAGNARMCDPAAPAGQPSAC